MPRSLKILLSPTAYKGTLTPYEAADLMADVLKNHNSAWKIVTHPLADGGDGTLEVLINYFRGEKRKISVMGPLGENVHASWGLVTGGIALIEMAEASGLKLLNGKNRIREATSYGTGELIRAALEAGCKRIFIGVGGTACSDGGAGALAALGFRFFNKLNVALKPTPAQLIHLHHVDDSQVDRRLERTKIFILCDVENPLIGKNGSARVFGPQKGATPSDVIFLEKFFAIWAKAAPHQLAKEPGTGAAGGIAFGLAAFLGASLVKGTDFIIRRTKWTKQTAGTDVIITGEGKLDRTSFSGKVVGEILRLKKRSQVMAICGMNAVDVTLLRKRGLNVVVAMGKEGLTKPRLRLVQATRKLLKHIKGNPKP